MSTFDGAASLGSRLEGKVAIVTGGGSGIGAATARLFVAEGASVLVVGRREEKLIEVVKEVGGDRISYTVADASKVEDTQRYITEAVARYGGLDILISNAGTEGPNKLVGDHTVEEFDEVMATNVRGVWLSFKYAAPELAKRGGGSVVLMSSIAGVAGLPTFSAYVASKHAVIGLAKTFALEGAGAGIRVNAVCPGLIDTDMVDRWVPVFAGVVGATAADVFGILNQRIPVHRKGTSEEIAKLNLFLASDDSSYVTGSVHVADGGVVAGLL